MVTILEVAVAGEAQGALEVITTDTWSASARVVEVKVAALVPALMPLTFHWKEGVVPPLVGVAVKVTDCPVQMEVEEAVMET